jgi:DNA-binding PadR family transcriptional regulator
MLTRAEELILLAVWRLRDKAYSVEIRGDLKAVTGRPWSFGAVYMPLDRLVKRGHLESHLADPTSERGGRSKRIYRLTNQGRSALKEIRRIQDTAWEGLPRGATEEAK